MAVSLGPFMTCFLAVLFLTVYIYIVIYVKKDILYSGMKLVFAGIALILIRMMIPFNFPFTQTIVSYKILPPVSRVLFHYFGDTRIGLAHILFVIWIAVSIGKLIYLIRRQILYRACLRPFVIRDKSKYPQLFRILEKCNASFSAVCVVPTKISPTVFGIFKPILVLPDCEFKDQDLYYICLHEAEHCRNHDLWLRLFLDLVICTQWFNPLVYFMNRQLTLAFELSNDRVILKTLDEMQRTEYAECVLKMVRYQNQKNKAMGSSLSFAQVNRSNVRTRVRYILAKEETRKKKHHISAILNYVVLGVVLLGTLFFVPEAYSTSERDQEQNIFEKIGKSYFIKLSDNDYLLYMDDKYVLTFDSIPKEFEDLPIIEEHKK